MDKLPFAKQSSTRKLLEIYSHKSNDNHEANKYK